MGQGKQNYGEGKDGTDWQKKYETQGSTANLAKGFGAAFLEHWRALSGQWVPGNIYTADNDVMLEAVKT